MTDGYGMKDMIQQINKLDFTSSEQFHLIGTVYEKMLSQMKDDSPGTFGEFYTPRPIIKFMVKFPEKLSKSKIELNSNIEKIYINKKTKKLFKKIEIFI